MARLTNREIADIFDNIADLLQIKGENVFRVNSYRNAAQTVRDLARDIFAIYEEGTLTDLPDIGATIAAKIKEMLTTGKLEFYARLTAEVPLSLVEVLRINGVGPKKAKLFWDNLGITTVAQLETAAREGKLQALSGMGAKSEQKIIQGIEALARRTDRVSIGIAYPLAMGILDDLLKLPQAIKGDVAGSLRRRRATIGDIDILIASADAPPIMDAFVTRPDVARVLGHGPTKSSVELVQGLQVDVRVLEPARYGTALSYFTGSQQHNIRMRELALKQGLSLNEHAFTPTDGGPEILCETEEAVYAQLGLPWIAPELREDRGEMEAAQAGRLPHLIRLEDIRGDLHMHTTWSDGKLSIREMAQAAKSRGLTHIVITDHSQLSAIAGGLTAERLLEQQHEIRAVDAEMGPDFRVLHGVEMDIRADGTMDLPDDILAQLDVVVASLHFSLGQPREQITQRVLNAIHNPHVDIIGHPRGQLIPEREPADLDMDAVFAAAKEHDTALEINANPRRLDLDDVLARRAQELGIKIAIDSDAHHSDNLDLLHFGVATARRGWIEAETVINTWSTERLLAWTNQRKTFDE
ncbi:MAG: DNA polymerase/3'-5' exonuclease PolX [Anaerolineales bacterium]|nr:DNA polymerase/3'-5' exonuclease PolX [Anaerolineales bacterium]